jgi:hypothetical protein
VEEHSVVDLLESVLVQDLLGLRGHVIRPIGIVSMRCLNLIICHLGYLLFDSDGKDECVGLDLLEGSKVVLG